MHCKKNSIKEIFLKLISNLKTYQRVLVNENIATIVIFAINKKLI